MRKFLIVALSAVALAGCGARYDAVRACYHDYPPSHDADGLVIFGAVGGVIAGLANNAGDPNKQARVDCVENARNTIPFDAPSVPKPPQN